MAHKVHTTLQTSSTGASATPRRRRKSATTSPLISNLVNIQVCKVKGTDSVGLLFLYTITSNDLKCRRPHALTLLPDFCNFGKRRFDGGGRPRFMSERRGSQTWNWRNDEKKMKRRGRKQYPLSLLSFPLTSRGKGRFLFSFSHDRLEAVFLRVNSGRTFPQKIYLVFTIALYSHYFF